MDQMCNLAGDTGFEPVNDGVKVRCLTAWRIPNIKWLRRQDSNLRPLGYEPNELPLLHSAMIYGGSNRDRTYDLLLVRQMLSQLSYTPI